MKKLSLLAILIAGLICSTGQQAKAQNQKGEFVASAGAGYSVLFGVISSLGSVSNAASGGVLSISTIPEINTTGDYGMSDHFSLGVGIGYQSCSITDDNFTDSSTGATGQNATVRISRLNIGFRPVWHFGNNPNIDFYFGMRVGVSIWSFGVTTTDPNFGFQGVFSGAVPSFQTFVGLKGYFSPVVGAHLELGIGTPYLVEAGLSFRFGNTGAASKS